jgi:membrane fusion protein, multidrug efflux system
MDMRHVIRLAVLASALSTALSASAVEASGPIGGPVPVGTIAALPHPVADAKDFVGRIEAVNRVEIRARVTGFLDDVLFREGDFVKKGQSLYRIEQPPFQADVEKAEGMLYRAQAVYADAVLDAERAQYLAEKGATPLAVRDAKVADKKSAFGNMLTAQAELASARIDLGYTEITAPVTGLIGRTSLTKGNLVGPASGVLATIVSQDPIYVVFPVSERRLLGLKRTQIERRGEAMYALIRFSDGTVYDKLARLDFLGVSVDESTDTVTVRGVVANPASVLVDRQLVRVDVEDNKLDQRVLIPQVSLLADQHGPYVFVVQNGKAATRRLTLGGESGPDVIVDSGLSSGEQVIVEGAQMLHPGAMVVPHPISPLPRELTP